MQENACAAGDPPGRCWESLQCSSDPLAKESRFVAEKGKGREGITRKEGEEKGNPTLLAGFDLPDGGDLTPLVDANLTALTAGILF